MRGSFDLTPDPKILIALTRTPMQPLDALCELIDNSIDAFHNARVQGYQIDHPLVVIDLPSRSDLQRGEGVIRVRDNGPGLSRDEAEKAIRAGYSSNNPYDRLGLFGMGFNISTGKFGRETRLLTARPELDEAIEVTIDLEEIYRSRSYLVPFSTVSKPQGFQHGTEIRISGWWPEGNPNCNFIRKLVHYGMPTIRSEIGRRYATILRGKQIRIVVNGEECEPFEHCVWSDSRSVERRDWGIIPAVYRFDDVIGTQKRCTSCNSLVAAELNECVACGSSSLRTIEERIRGWVGIQRFDDETEYGIDLIRNGRAIRISEKDAFFTFTDEFKRTIRDYPADGIYGRIVGEVHLDHVPVDFLKQDFQRSSPEWQRAMSYLRGDSSLQPTQPGADKNRSPVFMLFQGYRRVRRPGKHDMYMGYWDASGPKRISREVEKELREKFAKKLPGYYDDSEWWKLVEQADRPPLEELVECPQCTAQNLKAQDTCSVCGYVLIPKECLNPECKKQIPKSAEVCPHCGKSQTPQVQTPWKCLVCGHSNAATRDACQKCGERRGTLSTLSREYLLANSNRSDELSVAGCTVPLADGSYSRPLDIDVYVTKTPIIPNQGSAEDAIPLVAMKGEKIEVFVDTSHRVFTAFHVRPQDMIAAEVALYIYDFHRNLVGYSGRHSLAHLQWAVLQAGWGDALEEKPDTVRNRIRALFDDIKEKLPGLIDGDPEALFDEIPKPEQGALFKSLLDNGFNPQQIAEMQKSGDYLKYVDDATLVRLFDRFPWFFLDGRYWDAPYQVMPDVPMFVIEEARERTKSTYLNCLEDALGYMKHRTPDSTLTLRARTSVEILSQKVV